MTQIRQNIRNRTEAADYIAECERAFHAALDETIEKVFSSGEVRTIALAGPTCSGKTTTAEKLARRIEADGRRAVRFSIDDFFHNRDDRNRVDKPAPDYDSAEALDLDGFGTFMKRLNAGKPVLVPHYSFETTSRVGYEEYIPDDADIYVFEGIQAVYPEITSRFAGGYKSIFISVADDVEKDGVRLTSHEIRLLRRLVRDWLFRGATAEFTLFLWEGVRENEEKNIYPNARGVDVTVNSYLPYEPYALARHAAPLLDSVPKESRFRAQADDLLRRLSVFDCPYIEDGMIPSNSVFREFIG